MIDSVDKNITLTSLQERRLFDTVETIISKLPTKAIDELMTGYMGDIDALIHSMMMSAEKAMFIGKTIDSESLDYLDNLKASMDSQLKKMSFNYFCTTVLSNFRMNWRNLEQGSLMQLYPWSSYLASRGSGKSYQYCYAFPLWRLYGYDVPHSWDDPRYMVFNNNYKETSLISSSIQLCKAHMTKIINEIDNNEIIKEKLNPNNRAKIGEMGVQTETGAIIHIRGASSAIRGLHTGACVVDDMPDESSLYSEEARQKLKELIKGTIEPTVEPFGYFIISGTPFSNAESDLYKVIKSDKRFKCFEYPIIFPDGRPLAPDRYTFEDLMRKKEELGTTVFAREYLVIPIDDSSSIFPYDILKRTTIGMENVDYATTVDNFPIKMTRVVIGVDFAISGNIGADFTVYSVVGMDAMKNYYLIYYERLKGASHNEQVDKIVVLDQMFRSNKVVCESNGFQSILAGLARERGLMNIDTFTTTEGNKKDLHNGWASLAALFERGQFKVPYKAGTTKEKTDYLFSEFSSITFRSDKGKLEAGSGHDDCVSSIFIAYQSLKEGKGSEPVVTML